MKITTLLMFAAICCLVDFIFILLAAQVFDILVAAAFVLILATLRKLKIYESSTREVKKKW
jgi:hypothetical protein